MRPARSARHLALLASLAVFATLPWVESLRLTLDSERPVASCGLLPTAGVSYLGSLDPSCPLRAYERVESIEVGGFLRAIYDRADLLAVAPTGAVRARLASGSDQREARVVLLSAPSRADPALLWLGLAAHCAALLVAARLLSRSTSEASLALAALGAAASAYTGCALAPSSSLLLDTTWILLPGMLAASATHLALVVSRERRLVERVRALAVLPYALAGLVTLVEWLMLRQHSELWELPDRMLCTWAVAAATMLIASSTLTLVESSSLRERRLAGVLIYASAVSLGLAVVASLGVGSSLPLAPRRTVALASALALGAFAYGLVRHGNLDAPRLVRWWTSYALHAALVASAAWALAQLGEHLWSWPALAIDPPILLSATFAALLVLDALRSLAWSLSEEWLTPWAPRLEGVRGKFLSDLASSPDGDRVMALLVDAVASALDARQATAFRQLDSGGWRLSSAVGRPLASDLARVAEELLRRLAAGSTQPTVARIRELPGQRYAEVAALRRSGVSIAFAVAKAGEPRGMVLLGASKRENDVSSDHLALIEQLARHAALAIEKADLEQDLLVQARLAGVGYAAAGLAHDLGRPLGEIFLEARLRLPEESPIRELASECIEHLERFLEEAKASRRGGLDAMPLALVLEAAAERVAERHLGRQPALRLAPRLPAVADGREVQRVVEELLENSMHWSAPGTPIELVALAEAGVVTVRVIDHGPGLSDAARRLAFEPFFSERASSGLGLTICRDIAERMHGILQLEPTPGGGTTAVLRLPEVH